MKKELNPLDEFFRESLGDVRVEPSASAKARFLEEASTPGGIGGAGWFRWYHLFIIAGIIISGAMAIFMLRSPESSVIHPVATVTPKATSPSIPANLPVQQDHAIPTNAKTSHSSGIITDEPVRRAEVKEVSSAKSYKTTPSKSSGTTAQTKQKTEDKAVINPESGSASIGKVTAPAANKTISVAENAKLSTGVEQKSDPLPTRTESSEGSQASVPEIKTTAEDPAPGQESKEIQGSGETSNSSAKPKPAQRNKIPSPIKFEPGFRYNIDFPLDGSSAEPVHSLNVEGKVRWGKFYVYTGAGYAIAKGFHQYEVKYNDYLGQYKKLDSITFAWDQKHYHLLPSYYMTETEVYDSSLKLDYYSLQKRYTRVRIPLMIGYDLYQKGRFSLGVQAGAEWDIFAGAREKEGSYTAGSKKIISVNAVTDELSKNRVFLIADFSVACRLSKRIYLLAEPRLNYLLPSSGNGSQSGQGLSPYFRGSMLIKF